MTMTIMSTKGGVGKTTLAANLGALLAGMGQRVLLVDADIQASLSKYFPLGVATPAAGLTRLLADGRLSADCVTPTCLNNLDIVVSDDPAGQLPLWLINRVDRGVRLRLALRSPAVTGSYDCILIDTQGAVGPLLDAAILSADLLLSPVTPEVLSAREFRDGTMALLQRLEPARALGAALAPLRVVIYRMDRTVDARAIGNALREHFACGDDTVRILDTCVPHAKAYREAATLRTPVHLHERTRRGPGMSAATVMHHLAWELWPQWRGCLAAGSPAPQPGAPVNAQDVRS